MNSSILQFPLTWLQISIKRKFQHISFVLKVILNLTFNLRSVSWCQIPVLSWLIDYLIEWFGFFFKKIQKSIFIALIRYDIIFFFFPFGFELSKFYFEIIRIKFVSFTNFVLMPFKKLPSYKLQVMEKKWKKKRYIYNFCWFWKNFILNLLAKVKLDFSLTEQDED